MAWDGKIVPFHPSAQGPARNIVRAREVQPRRSIRLSAWDYSDSGAYFVTICTHHRECILDDAANLAIVEDVWRRVVGSGHGAGEFVAMPNHVHGIVWIEEPDAVGAEQPDAAFDQPPAPSNDYLFRDDRRGEDPDNPAVFMNHVGEKPTGRRG